MSEALSLQLRSATTAEHKDAENSPFMVMLMSGRLSLDDYTRYLINMAWLYEALEEQTTVGEPLPGSAELWDERLLRLSSISYDLENLGVPNWRQKTRPSHAMESYISHLRALGGRGDHRLIAHHYTRYLGDLSGGQAIASLVARHYGASDDQLSFYRFERIDNLVRFKEHYRECLDRVILTNDQRVSLLEEAKGAFRRNQSVFSDLNSSGERSHGNFT